MKSFTIKKPLALIALLASAALGLFATAALASPVRLAFVANSVDWAALALIGAFALLLGAIVVEVWRATLRQANPLHSIGSSPWTPRRGEDRAEDTKTD
jgi:hypothetical protein